jgi:molecular chaperone GrpE
VSAAVERSDLNREGLVRRIGEWLEQVLTAEEPPAGLAAEILSAAEADEPEGGADLYSLWSAMTTLAQEVKLQGRAFQDLSQKVETLPSREREKEVQRETERRCRKEALQVLIDLQDRLERGLESVRAWKSPQRSWLQRMVLGSTKDPPDDAIAALRKGYELGIERIDQTLDEFNARRMNCQGELFDPRRMNAVDREETTAVPEGTVVEVYRNGYEWNGEVLRSAQVKVSCAPK